MAIVLGKALFWDTQVGSDGMSCASCHFHAGADNRTKNQLGPGILANPPDNSFGNSSVAGVTGFTQFGPNYTLTANDFTFHQVTDPMREDYNHRVIIKDTNDAVSSQGVFKANFTGIVPGQANDAGAAVADPIYNVGGVNVRRVEPRNTPTVINAVFNVDNFWDGRAKNQFNGINPFGPLDSNATILVNSIGTLSQVQVSIPNSSLASQAVGPPLSDLEMSYVGRTFPDIGKKMLAARPLNFQRVHVNDSVLGPFSRASQNPPLNGLTFITYTEMVQTVFQSKYWDSANIITFDVNGNRVINPPGTPNGYTQMEANFSLFFGLAVQAYESTLVSDRTRFDLFMEGDNQVLTQDEMAGLLAFVNAGTPAQLANPLFTDVTKGACINCHRSATFSDATFTGQGVEGQIELEPAPFLIDGAIRVGTELVLLDNGYYNIGVRPTSEDLGRGGTALGKPLSASRQALAGYPFAPRIPANAPQNPRVQVDGAFKVPTLRNVEMTGPYFHNGCQQTLRQLLLFYHRHGDFGESNIANIDSPLALIKLDARVTASGRDLDTDQLVKFMLTLTDDRVRYEMAPFDHPQLFVPNGHQGDSNSITQFTQVNGVNVANDDMLEIPAVGREGRQAEGLDALSPFMGTGALQATTISLRGGWNTLSTPVKLHSSMDTWGEITARAGLSYQVAYRWDGTAFQAIDQNYVLTPLDAIFVKMNTSATMELVPTESVSSPPTKALTPGWNLVGSAFLDAEMPVKDALVSAYFAPQVVPNAVPPWGYTQIVSPSTNALEWTYIRDGLNIPSMVLGEGYWVNMVNAGQISGFTSTPVLVLR
ncbi:MAG: hypothetical protein HYX79_10650 [Chloroflexi bacterium]|nr:hypothetical protein [Chloroflexota bacterium]